MLYLSKVAISFPRMTVIMFVWCRAYDCRSLVSGFDLPPFPVGWSPCASLSGFNGPIEGLACCALV